jgi:hypothetical protein
MIDSRQDQMDHTRESEFLSCGLWDHCNMVGVDVRVFSLSCLLYSEYVSFKKIKKYSKSVGSTLSDF